MPYFTLIGPHGANRFNRSGFGSRGYWLFRRDSTVVTRWGGVVVVGRSPFSVSWSSGYAERVIKCRTVEAATAELARRIALLTRAAEGYARMPRGMRIGAS